MDSELPQTLGYESAGVVDEVGEGAADVTVGDHVFGLCPDRAAQAELAVLSHYAPIPLLPARLRRRGRVAGRRRDGHVIDSGRFTLPVAQSFPPAEVAETHRVGERGRFRGKLVLMVG